MLEELENAKEELKRIDHLIYVTLKYTRTVDVLISVVERMINCYEFMINALIKKAVADGSLETEPDNPITKAQEIIRLYTSKTIKANIEKYLMFRKLRRVAHEKMNEFRRHVTLTAEVDGKEIKVHIDNITEDFHDIKKFMEHVEKTVK
jgi:hypothetical protein